jgi:hypothetical protein
VEQPASLAAELAELRQRIANLESKADAESKPRAERQTSPGSKGNIATASETGGR